MEEKVHYPVALHKENGEKNENYQFIPLINVVLDPGMEFMGRIKCHKICLKKRLKHSIMEWKQIYINGIKLRMTGSGKEMDL